MPDHVGDRGAAHLDSGASRSPTYQADEHAQTSVSEHGDRHSPRLAGAPDGAEAARRVARGGRAAICRQNPSSRGRGADGLCLGAASLHPGHLRGIGPRTWTLTDLEGPRSPATEQPGIRGLRIGLPARQWRLRRLRPVCPVSTTSWRYDLRRTCRLVTGRSHRPRSTWPDQARLPLLTVTHRYKRAHCLWLEQFQIADSALKDGRMQLSPAAAHISHSGVQPTASQGSTRSGEHHTVR